MIAAKSSLIILNMISAISPRLQLNQIHAKRAKFYLLIK